MTITYSAPNGTQITASAVEETLATQAQANGVDEIVFADDIVANATGNISSDTTFQTYVGRLVILRPETGTEEVRMCIAETAGTGTTIIATVNEAWISAPATSDVAWVPHVLDDIENGGAGGGVALSAKTGVYEFTNDLFVGDGTNPATLQIAFGERMEIDDVGTAAAGFQVRDDGGRFFSGYTQGGVPVAGGFIFGINNAQGENWIDWNTDASDTSGGEVNDLTFLSNLEPLDFVVNTELTDLIFRKCKIVQPPSTSATAMSYVLRGQWEDLTWQGSGSSAEVLSVAAGQNINGAIIISTAGFDTITTGDDPTLKDVTFIDSSPLVTIGANELWTFINPVWTIDETGQNELNFTSTTANDVDEQYSLDVTVQEPDGTAVGSAFVIVYEELRTDNLVLELTADGSGVVSSQWNYKNYTPDGVGTTMTVLTDGQHALRVFKHGFTPFISALTSNTKFDGVVTLITDPDISEANEVTARALLPASDDPVRQTEPLCLLSYDTGVNTLGVGETVTGGTSSATGVVVEIMQGDSTSGRVLLDARNATAFQRNESLSSSGTWTGGVEDAFDYEQEFSLFIECTSSELLQDIYDWQAAHLAETTLDADWEVIHEWGGREQGYILEKGGTGFFTPSANERAIVHGTILATTANGTSVSGSVNNSARFRGGMVVGILGVLGTADQTAATYNSINMTVIDVNPVAGFDMRFNWIIGSGSVNMPHGSNTLSITEGATENLLLKGFSIDGAKLQAPVDRGGANATDNDPVATSNVLSYRYSRVYAIIVFGNATLTADSTWTAVGTTQTLSSENMAVAYIDTIGTAAVTYDGALSASVAWKIGFVEVEMMGEGIAISNINDTGNLAYLTDDNGTQWIPPTTVTVEITNLIAGSRVYIRDTDADEVLWNVIEATSTFSESFEYTADVNIEVKVRNSTAPAPFYKPFETTGQITSSGYTAQANQPLDE